MSVITYQKATLPDIPLLAEARISFLSEYWGNVDEEQSVHLRNELRNYFEYAIQHKIYHSWIAKFKDEFAGIGGMVYQQRPGSFRVPDGRSAYIMNMYTVPKFRKNGIAKNILEHLIKTGNEDGIQFFELHATKEGEPIYVNAGFELHKEPTFRKFVV